MGSSLLWSSLPKIGLKSTEISTFFDIFAQIHTFYKEEGRKKKKEKREEEKKKIKGKKR